MSFGISASLVVAGIVCLAMSLDLPQFFLGRMAPRVKGDAQKVLLFLVGVLLVLGPLALLLYDVGRRPF